MRGITGGVLGPTGPTPLLPTGPTTGASGIGPARGPGMLELGYHLQVTTGMAFVGSSSGGCSTGAGLVLVPTGLYFFPFAGTPARALHVLVPLGGQVRWLLA